MGKHTHNWSWDPYWEDGPDRMLFICIVKDCDESLALVEVEDYLNSCEPAPNPTKGRDDE